MGLGLAIPFIVTFVVPRVLCDTLSIKPDLAERAELGVGGACGAVSGIVSTGPVSLLLATCKSPATSCSYGVKRDRGGQLKTRNSLLVPVHSITAGLYNTLSTGVRYSLWRNGSDLARNTTLFHDTVDGGKCGAMPTNAVKFTGDLHRVLVGTGESWWLVWNSPAKPWTMAIA